MMPKTGAQRSKDYRERRRENPLKIAKKLPKSSTERVREWREKRRSLKDYLQSNLLSATTSSSECSTESTTSQNVDYFNQHTSTVKQESAVDNVNDDATLCDGVKQEFIEIELTPVDTPTCTQDTSTPAGVGSLNVDQDVCVKHEPEDTDLDVGPTLFQHMDSWYKTNQNTSADANEPILYRRVQEECVKNKCGEPNIYICDYCQKTFTNRNSMKAHIICMHAMGTYICDQCGKSFKCEQNLTLHKANVHTARMTMCNVCGTYLKPISLKCHMECMHSDEELQCNVCGETVKSKYYFQQHMSDEHQAKLPDQQSAEICGKSHRHSECNKESTMESYNCVRTKQDGKLQYECVPCEKTYKTRSGVLYHNKIHHPPRSADLPLLNRCNYCQKIYFGKKNLNAHMKYVHGPRCPECKASFISEIHIKLIHSQDKAEDVIVPKSSTERVRAYREKQRAQRPPKKPAKSGLLRVREYRARQEALKSSIAALASGESVDGDR